jgi:predicted nucleotidyltransferase
MAKKDLFPLDILFLSLFLRSFIIKIIMLSEAEIDKIKSVVSGKEEIAYAILFGSALKHPLSHSDIDLLIGGDLGPRQKTDLSMSLALELHRAIDIVITKEARCDVVLRAFSSGILLTARDKRRVKEDYFNHYRLCDQEHLLKRVKLERLKRVYGNG